MTTFPLDKHHTASFITLRTSSGYVARGTILQREKIVETFEAIARSMPDIDKNAREMAEQVFAHLTKVAAKKG